MAEEYKNLKKGGEHFRSYREYNIGGVMRKLPLVNNSIRANELFLTSQRRNQNAMIRKLKKSPKTDTMSQRTMKAFQNRVTQNLHSESFKRDKKMLIEHDVGAEKMPAFMSMPTPKEEKDALWKLIKGRLKSKGT